MEENHSCLPQKPHMQFLKDGSLQQPTKKEIIMGMKQLDEKVQNQG